MKEIGIIQETKNATAKVMIKRHAACGDCCACQVGKEKMTMETMANNPIQAKIGECVEVEMEFTNLFTAALIMYGMPLIAFIVGCMGLYYTIDFLKLSWDPVLVPFFTGILLTAITYGSIKIADKKGAFKSKYQPTIMKVVNEESIKKTPIESKMG